MSQSLYRKYRPKKLSEVIGQEHITATLEQALKSGKLSHAYLLSGPRGVGKTSIARILAHIVNGLPYTDESTHLDIIEIDAASNRRIDEIRDLRERVHIAPTSAKYKVYIIDEVHMLTREAFNALLKTLEEPPKHVIFILATTEAHKLPETIVSRTQRFSFRPVQRAEVIKHLKSIAESEHIKIDDAALQLIAEHGEGSFRDSIGLLDQASSMGSVVDQAAIERLLGIATTSLVKQASDLLESGTPQTAIEWMDRIREQGIDASRVARQLAQFLRQQIVSDDSVSEKKLELLHALARLESLSDPELGLELALLRALPTTQVDVRVHDTKPTQALEPVSPLPAESRQVEHLQLDEQAWNLALDSLKTHFNTLYGVLRLARPDFSEFNSNKLTLSFRFPFHQKKATEAKHRKAIANALKQVTGQDIDIVCVVDGSQGSPTDDNEAPDGSLPPIDSIVAVFGNAEVLE